MRLAGKVAVVTGGASGMGLETVMKFASEGARVVTTDFNEQTGAVAVDAATQQGFDVSLIKTDVAKESDVEAMCQHAIGTYGRLDILFNNAGVGGAIGPLTETTVEDWDYTFDVMAKGFFPGIKHGARIMRRQGDGGSTAECPGRSRKFPKMSARNFRYAGVTKGSTGAKNHLRKLANNKDRDEHR